jgi:KUP system potassium uptake protein
MLRQREPKPVRVPGTAVFLNRNTETAPLALRANVRHNHVLHEEVVIVVVTTEPVPRVADADRVTVEDILYSDDGIYTVTARFGYMEAPDVPAALRLIDPQEMPPVDIDQASYFLNKLELTVGAAATMAPWRKRLFIATSFISADSAGFFGLPLDRTVIIGARLPV